MPAQTTVARAWASKSARNVAKVSGGPISCRKKEALPVCFFPTNPISVHPSHLVQANR